MGTFISVKSWWPAHFHTHFQREWENAVLRLWRRLRHYGWTRVVHPWTWQEKHQQVHRGDRLQSGFCTQVCSSHQGKLRRRPVDNLPSKCNKMLLIDLFSHCKAASTVDVKVVDEESDTEQSLYNLFIGRLFGRNLLLSPDNLESVPEIKAPTHLLLGNAFTPPVLTAAVKEKKEIRDHRHKLTHQWCWKTREKGASITLPWRKSV